MRWKKAALENCPGIPCITNTVPGAPTGVVATVGAASASVAFTAPSSTGGSAITGYTVTFSPGSYTSTGTSSPIIITGLINGTAYTFTVVATNAVGNSVASAASTAVTPAAIFICGTSTITDVDNNSYNTVLIGAQCWTKQNLKVTKYNDNTTSIPDQTANTGWPTLGFGARTEYVAAGVASYVSTYGYLYNWYAAKGIITTGGVSTKNICPTGWHVPSDSDWNKLAIGLDMTADTTVSPIANSTTAGTLMKANSAEWNVASTPSPGTNTSGFTGLPGGIRNNTGAFVSIGTLAFFWSTTPQSASFAYVRFLQHDSGNLFKLNTFNNAIIACASIRCLKD